MSVPKFLIKSLLKLKQVRRLKKLRKASGFTLLELLVALVLTFLIITPLMSLVISLMTTDRQEQAKNSSQQEIQAALEYIAQDLQQAVYIYDAAALNTGTSSNVQQSGIKDQIPPVANTTGCSSTTECVPVLAFWKRKFFDRNDTIDSVTISSINDGSQGSDRFVYSLVVYYLIKDSRPGGNQNTPQTWSPIARIGRFELRDGAGDKTKSPYLQPNPGFAQFDLSKSPGSIQQSLNSWVKGSASYTQPVEILVDYIDDTLLADMPPSVQNQFTPPLNNTTDTNYNSAPASTECEKRLVSSTGAGTSSTPLPIASRVPPDGTIPAQLTTGSFYACVKPVNSQGQSVAQVYLRGNALPRLNNNSQTWKVNSNNLSYVPIANVRIAVRGLLGSSSN